MAALTLLHRFADHQPSHVPHDFPSFPFYRFSSYHSCPAAVVTPQQISDCICAHEALLAAVDIPVLHHSTLVISADDGVVDWVSQRWEEHVVQFAGVPTIRLR